MSDNFVNKMKKFMGFDEEYEYEDEYEEDEYEEEDEVVDEVVNNTLEKTHNITGKGGANKVVNIHSNTQMKVVVYEPTKYEEAPEIVNNLKNRKAVIVNLENIENTELAKTIFDFLNGAIYALDGSIYKISEGIFVIAPNNVEIDGTMKTELENKVLFPWQK
ncbi:MAG: cell division protein SepF [Peptostreptococcaceae bacterium]|jgi:cell division inhibitor SepF|nr:cell division protein SepF [Peptostreptococcaceae bacterium]